jgi:hypothetical protein
MRKEGFLIKCIPHVCYWDEYFAIYQEEWIIIDSRNVKMKNPFNVEGGLIHHSFSCSDGVSLVLGNKDWATNFVNLLGWYGLIK